MRRYLYVCDAVRALLPFLVRIGAEEQHELRHGADGEGYVPLGEVVDYNADGDGDVYHEQQELDVKGHRRIVVDDFLRPWIEDGQVQQFHP